MIRNIIFDIGGVLVDFNPAKVFARKNIGARKIETLLAATVGNPIWRELDRGVMDESEIIERMKKSAPKDCAGDIDWFFSEGMKTVVTPFEYSTGWLKSLREKNFKIYLLSNYPKRIFEMHSETSFPFLESVDGKIVSGFVNLIKPDPRIYETLMREYDLRADECVFIDDMIENVKAARALGMGGIHFTSYVRAREALSAMLPKDF